MEKLKKRFSVNFRIMTFLTITTFGSPSFTETQRLDLAQLSDGFEAETTYMISCFACHSTGAAGAPKVGSGNAAAWSSRLEKGMGTIVQNAIVGINNMPPTGLCFTCTDAEISALVQYMIENSQ
jgi:cytochrome c5